MRIAVDCQKDRITQHFADHLTTKECHDYMRERERLVDVDNMIGSFHISRLIDIYCNTFRKCVLFGDWKDARDAITTALEEGHVNVIFREFRQR